MDGRLFSGLHLVAYIADGSEKFRKSKEKKTVLDDEEDENNAENQRLDQFGTWLEEEGAGE